MLTLSAINAFLKKRDSARLKKEAKRRDFVTSNEGSGRLKPTLGAQGPSIGSSTALERQSPSTPSIRRSTVNVAVSVALIATAITSVSGYSTGAGSIQLATAHGSTTWPATTMCHSIIATQNANYRSWTIKLVASTAGTTYEGIFLYTENSAAAKVGSFSPAPSGMRLKSDCSGVSAGPILEHTSKTAKNLPAIFIWTAPPSILDGSTITVKGLENDAAHVPTIFETSDAVWLMCSIGAVLAIIGYSAEEFLKHLELVRVRRVRRAKKKAEHIRKKLQNSHLTTERSAELAENTSPKERAPPTKKVASIADLDA
ncbi:hypothetical protein HDU93_003575 [Gonapodya sp. JEL0774]|nr:hypothetical protein HDU93_003575 [Gonapodya sp. JEL0774]